MNATVHVQAGDLKRVPFATPQEDEQKLVARLSKQNVKWKKKLTSFDIIEPNYVKNPIEFEDGSGLRDSLFKYMDHENNICSQLLINEAIIEKTIFKVYDLTESDRDEVLNQQGTPCGMYPISHSAQDKNLGKDYFSAEKKQFISELQNITISPEKKEQIKEDVLNDYQDIDKGSDTIRELSEKYEINPLTISEWIAESEVLPENKCKHFSKKYILELARNVMMEDDDGVVPIVDFSGEKTLQSRILDKFVKEKELSQKDINVLENFLEKEINAYVRNDFFEDQCDILNLFMYQPKTPFIWHMSSGPEAGFEAAIIIYKWKRDRLMTIRNKYLEKRRQSLNRQLNNLGSDESAEAQEKREMLRAQLHEIDEFEEKVEDLLNSGYDPDIDDGVGYNIAPLQKRGMLKSAPLTSSQLDKFLNADWGSRAE